MCPILHLDRIGKSPSWRSPVVPVCDRADSDRTGTQSRLSPSLGPGVLGNQQVDESERVTGWFTMIEESFRMLVAQ